MHMNNTADFITYSEEGYELIDSGDEEKLERFGSIVLRRPDPQALWSKMKGEEVWQTADATFISAKTGGSWQKGETPEKWNATIAGVSCELSFSQFKHIGIFPEQSPNWKWIREVIQKSGRPVKVLNLFGYTGGATVACLQAGASVTHIDASKTAVTSARRNSELSGVVDKPVRWMLDDVRKFVEREIRRGEVYDAIIMDPPAFGHGAKKELWNIERDLLPLIELTKKILSPEPLFYILNGYASGYSAIAYKQCIDWLTLVYGGAVEYGELLIEEKGTGRFLPAGITARWKNK